MRIYIAVRHSNDSKKFYGGLWSSNFYPALKALGHELIESTIDLLPTSKFMHIADGFTAQELQCRADTTEKILAEVKAENAKAPIGLFLSYFYNSHFEPGGFESLRQLGIKTVNFYCNSIYQFELVKDVARAADFAWHAERHARQSYLAAGANPVWVQMAADPKMYHPVGPGQIIPKACFVGQRYADREDWLSALLDANLPIDIYGSGWSKAQKNVTEVPTPEQTPSRSYLGRSSVRLGSISAYTGVVRKNIKDSGLVGGIIRSGSQFRKKSSSNAVRSNLGVHAKGNLPQEKVCETYTSYGVVLNLSNVWADGRPGSPLIPHVRLRDFEAPMCGAFYMTGFTDEIAECYKIDSEIVTYASIAEFVEKVKFYLKNKESAERIAASGYRRALSDHTWVNRFETLLKKLT